MIASAGNKGDTVRSDCFVEITLNPGQGNLIHLQSRVGSLYGNSIRELCLEILDFYEVKDAKVEVVDTGALPFVIAARMEAALKQFIKGKRGFLFELLPQNRYKTAKDKNRRSRLYLPGNNPKLMVNAGIYGADGIILDLEDSVAPDKKEEARLLVRNALSQVDFYGAERMVRINQIPKGIDDLEYIVPYNVNTILIPKCEWAQQVRDVEKEISRISGKEDGGIHLMPIIESALGVENAYQIASASPNVVAMAIGLEDYTADIGVVRTDGGRESYVARSRVVNAACAAGIQPIDSVFSDFEDMEALAANARESKALGFVGMGCIHPRQVKVVNETFSPGKNEIEKAKEIVIAFDKAQREGKAVVAVGSKMVDPPVVKRAIYTIDNAINAGKLDKNWRAGNE
ncbi:MAG: citrate lyase ACP [Chlorobi bacterium]|nr:citrate lyase ACP [Chlorobiota bacterium]